MILDTKRLEDSSGMCEVARKLSTYHKDCFMYDLIADTGHDQDEGHPLCVIKDDGDRLDIIFMPYDKKKLRKKITLEYYEANYLAKLIVYMEQQLEEKNGA